MNIDDLLVEVRDSSLTLVGAIPIRDMNLEASVPSLGMGSWIVRLPEAHEMAPLLRAPGNGIVVSDVRGGATLFSGPITSPALTMSSAEGAMIEVQGITDEHVLADRLASPDPAIENIRESISSSFTAKGPAESVMHELVRVNAGQGATPDRRTPGLNMGPDLQRGELIEKSVRFENLLEVLTGIATEQGLGFRVLQEGEQLVFRTREFEDRREEVRISVNNGRAKEGTVQIEPPTVTRAIVAAGSERWGYIESTSDAALQAESEWGRRIEQLYVGNSKKEDELIQTGAEAIATGGYTNIASQATAVDHDLMTYGTDWNLGDLVTIEVADVEYYSEISGFKLLAQEGTGFEFGIVLGDAVGMNNAQTREIRDLGRKISELTSASSDQVDIEDWNEKMSKFDVDLSSLREDISAIPGDLTDLRADLDASSSRVREALESVTRNTEGIAAEVESKLAQVAEFESDLSDIRAIAEGAETIAGAKAKADAAQAAAIAAAAKDASAKADAAAAEAISRGLNLVTNGTGLLGTNRNFPNLTFDGTDAPTGSKGSFLSGAGSRSIFTTDSMPVDPNKVYEYRFSVKHKAGTPGQVYGCMVPIDAYGYQITPQSIMQFPGTLTTLAKPLVKGDTTVTLTSAAGWQNAAGANSHFRSLIFWDYVDAGGKKWPALTYSRNFYTNVWDDGKISGNVITLRSAWAGPDKPAGTQLSNGSSGSTYMYVGAVAAAVPNNGEWLSFSGRTEKGTHPTNVLSAATTRFPAATAQVKVGFLLNYGKTAADGTSQAVGGISLVDVTAAVDAQANAKAEAERLAEVARLAAVGAAAVDAKSKADAAAASAISAAAVDATAKAAAAQDAAKAAAAADAKSKADAAEASAKAAAAADAKSKADAAQAAAVAAAKTEADAAKLAAIQAAATDAKSKADTAQSAAISAAATDAKSKADAARAAAISAAAADAQSKADAAKAAALAKATEAYERWAPTGQATIDGGKITADSIQAAQIDTGSLTAELVAAGVVIAGDVRAGTITSSQIGVGEVKAGNVDSGAITTVKLAANSVRADKMMIGSTENILSDPSFAVPLGALGGWASATGLTLTASGQEGNALTFANTATQQATYNQPQDIPCEPGARYYMSFTAKQVGAALPAGGAVIGARFRLADGTVSMGGAIASSALAVNTWKRFSGQSIEAPANTVSVSFYIASQASNATGTLYVSQASVIRAATGELIVDGSITADKILATQIKAKHMTASAIESDHISGKAIKAGHINTDAVTADAIKAGEVKAEHIRAGAITADKLTVATFGDNLVVNGSFNDATSAGVPIGWVFDSTVTAKAALVSGTGTSRALTFTTVTSPSGTCYASADASYGFAQAGDEFHFSMNAVTGTSGTTGSMRFLVHYYNAADTWLGVAYSDAVTVAGAAASALGANKVTGKATIPASATTATRVRFGFQPTTGGRSYYVSNFVVGKMVTAVQIGQGAVQAQHITAKTLEGKHLKGNTIESATLTSSLLRTGESGARWEIGGLGADATTIRAYAPADVSPANYPGGIQVAGKSGKDSTSGLTTARTFSVMRAPGLLGETNAPSYADFGVDAFAFPDGVSTSRWATVTGTAGIAGAVKHSEVALKANSIYLKSGTNDMDGISIQGPTQIVGTLETSQGLSSETGTVTAKNAIMSGSTSTGTLTTTGATTSGGLLTAKAGLSVTGAVTASGAVTSTGLLTARAGVTVTGTTTTTGVTSPNTLALRASSGSVGLYATAGARIEAGGWFGLYTSGNTTTSFELTAAGAPIFRRITDQTYTINAHIAAGGTIFRNGSLRALKLVIEDIELERLERLLELQPKTWIDRRAAEAYAESIETGVPAYDSGPLVRVPGLVAEDVQDAGLPEFTTVDEQGNLMGVAYDRIGVAWMPLVKGHRDRIAALESENALLREQLASIEERLSKAGI